MLRSSLVIMATGIAATLIAGEACSTSTCRHDSDCDLNEYCGFTVDDGCSGSGHCHPKTGCYGTSTACQCAPSDEAIAIDQTCPAHEPVRTGICEPRASCLAAAQQCAERGGECTVSETHTCGEDAVVVDLSPLSNCGCGDAPQVCCAPKLDASSDVRVDAAVCPCSTCIMPGGTCSSEGLTCTLENSCDASACTCTGGHWTGCDCPRVGDAAADAADGD